MHTIELLLALVVVGLVCAYRRTPVFVWSVASLGVLLGFTLLANVAWWALLPLWLVLGGTAVLLNVESLRKQYLSAPMLKIYERITPQISDTEQTALEAGTVGWEGELFSGQPTWSKLLSEPVPRLSDEERAFIDGPVEELGKLINDWEISHEIADLTPETWEFLKKNRFFGMIIPKRYGGLEFSAYAHSMVLQKVASMSPTAASTVAVPNSLGPAELLLHYGTDEQKAHYLPRLAVGLEVPCFALTSPYAGSDATSIPDFGIVCKETWHGKETLGIKLTFDKRYITLAPIATVIGLAFKLHDPDGLLGGAVERGITLALIPRSTPGVEVGRRHLPLNIPFQNGPVRGKGVFIPMDYLIGGEEYIGQGWRMLVECLSVGRSISLPSNSVGAMKHAAYAIGAYARIRKQFNQPIGRFEGIEEALARVAGYTYAVSALARSTAAAVDRGERPSVPSAIAKYHATELGRAAIADAMDVAAGKGVILGPKNWIGRAWQGSPISVTVEGANILTRSLMIFGQGAIRCHPYVLKEMKAAQIPDPIERLHAWDEVLFSHVGFAFSNAARAFLLGLSFNLLAQVPGDAKTKRFYRKLTRYSAALALIADVSMLTLGGKLKVKERLSARLGDVLSQLYIGSAMLKRFEDQGRPSADAPLLAWAMHDAIYKIQKALDEYLANFPVRPLAALLRVIVFPLGRRERPVGDNTGRRAANAILNPSETRDRLIDGIYTTPTPGNVVGAMNQTMIRVINAEPVERKLMKALKSGQIPSGLSYEDQLKAAFESGVLSETEKALLEQVRAEVADVIAVDDFDPIELVAEVRGNKPVVRRAA
jgi:acyl-CoA dehydrogenase